MTHIYARVEKLHDVGGRIAYTNSPTSNKKVENVLQILQSTYNTVVIPVTLEHIQKLKVYSYLYKYYDNLDWFLFGSMEEFNKNIPDILENRENYLTIFF